MKGKNQRQLGSDHAKAVTTDCGNCQFPGERQKSTHLQPSGTERKTGLKDVVKPTSGGAPTHLQPSGKQASNPRLAALRAENMKPGIPVEGAKRVKRVKSEGPGISVERAKREKK